MRADRLVAILLELQQHGQLTAGELAERLAVSERTILRDMEALGTAGIPVTAARGAGGGWRLIDGYETRLTGLTAAEIQALFFSRPPRALADLGLDAAAQSAWTKLVAALGNRGQEQAAFVQQRILIDPRGWRDASHALVALPKLIEALWRGRQVRFDYENALQESGERLVHPLGLVAKGSIWYLVASRADARRTYRVSRIGNVVVEEAAAIRPSDFDLARYWEESATQLRERLPEVYATYLVEPSVLRWVRYKGWRLVEQSSDGERVRIRVRFDSEEEAVQLALAHGLGAELLEPAALRAIVRDAAERTADKYVSER